MTGLGRVAAVEASGRAAMPALDERVVGGWLLRVSGGATRRVNSANPATPGAHPQDVVGAADRFYAERGQACRFRLTPLAHDHADAALPDAGYAVIDHSLTTLAALPARTIDPTITQMASPTATDLARLQPLSGRSDLDTHARLIARMPGPLALATPDEGDDTVAAGLASAGRGRARLSDTVVAPAAGGRGAKRRLGEGLLGWAAHAGCREAMLQVFADDASARRLYRSLGFADAYPCHYRVRA